MDTRINDDDVTVVMNPHSPFVPAEIDNEYLFETTIKLLEATGGEPERSTIRLPVPQPIGTKKNRIRFQNIKKAPMGVIDKSGTEFIPRATGVFKTMELSYYLAHHLDLKAREN